MKCECCGQTIRKATSEKFKEFWSVYPNKIDKIDSERVWKRDKLDHMADEIIAKVRLMMDKDPRWVSGYVMSPYRFLNKQHWTDEINLSPKVMQWPTKNDDWLELGKKHNIHPGAGEGWPQFKDKVRRAIGE